MAGRAIALLLFSSLLGAGCGRSSLMGHSSSDCPGPVNPDGTCGSSDLRPVDMRGDMRDGGDMGQCPEFCGQFCGADPQCCNCNFCQTDPSCEHIDMRRDMGDMKGDLCSDPNNCMLPECIGDPRCRILGAEVCNNGIDDDDDGLVDCKDSDCVDFPACKPHMCNDAMPDCTDPACVNNPKCKDLQCHPTV